MRAAEVGRSLVRISFPPGFEFLGPIRMFVSAYLEKRLSARVAERAVVASHELLENAAKYGSIAAEVVLEIRQPSDDAPIEIHVTNTAFEQRRRLLLERLSELRRTSPAEAYARAIVQSRRGVGRLGLARVLHEGNMDLDVSIDGDVVTMLARFRNDVR